jgi:hypothetical protein
MIIWTRDWWQNYHNFDPSFRWTWREEQKALRKVDSKIFGWILVMFFALSELEGDSFEPPTDCRHDPIESCQRHSRHVPQRLASQAGRLQHWKHNLPLRLLGSGIAIEVDFEKAGTGYLDPDSDCHFWYHLRFAVLA